MTFTARLSQASGVVNERLHKLLTPGEHFGPPKPLANAMQYAVLNGGKRFRPFLVLESARLFGVSTAQAQDTACALELLHSYSLIHDDLPSMDDDDMRRGQPSVHKAYNEATAILAGDALLTLAFEVLGSQQCHPSAVIRSRLVLELAQAAGWAGMVGGQMLDLLEEKADKPARLGVIQRIQSMKTGALIEFACAAGAILGNAGEQAEGSLREYGQAIGLAYQISDDLLDLKGDAALVGKAVRKDEAAGKATVISRIGHDKALRLLDDLEASAIAALEPFGEAAQTLRETAKFISRRER